MKMISVRWCNNCSHPISIESKEFNEEKGTIECECANFENENKKSLELFVNMDFLLSNNIQEEIRKDEREKKITIDQAIEIINEENKNIVAESILGVPLSAETNHYIDMFYKNVIAELRKLRGEQTKRYEEMTDEEKELTG